MLGLSFPLPRESNLGPPRGLIWKSRGRLAELCGKASQVPAPQIWMNREAQHVRGAGNTLAAEISLCNSAMSFFKQIVTYNSYKKCPLKSCMILIYKRRHLCLLWQITQRYIKYFLLSLYRPNLLLLVGWMTWNWWYSTIFLICKMAPSLGLIYILKGKQAFKYLKCEILKWRSNKSFLFMWKILRMPSPHNIYYYYWWKSILFHLSFINPRC